MSRKNKFRIQRSSILCAVESQLLRQASKRELDALTEELRREFWNSYEIYCNSKLYTYHKDSLVSIVIKLKNKN